MAGLGESVFLGNKWGLCLQEEGHSKDKLFPCEVSAGRPLERIFHHLLEKLMPQESQLVGGAANVLELGRGESCIALQMY